MYLRLKEKVGKGLRLTDEELMEFIILPLSYRKKDEKERKVQETVELAVHIRDRGQQLFALAGILAFTDKVIDTETVNKIRRAIEMTQVARIFEEEKQEALAQAARMFEKEKQQAVEQAVEQISKKAVIRMIKMDLPTEKIVSIMPDYSQDDVEKIRQEAAELERV